MLVLSPHADDAALCVGGLLLLPAARCWEQHIGTIVGISDYAVESHSARMNVEEVSAARRCEDRLYAQLIGARLHQGKILDAPLRCRTRSPFRAPMKGEYHRFEELVERWAQEINPRLILAPAGIGGHVDHCLTRSVAEVVATRQDSDLLLYEDLPYAAMPDQRSFRDLNPPIVQWEIATDATLLRKIAYLGAYVSQFDLASMQRLIALHSQDGADHVERLYVREDINVNRDTADLLGLIRRR